MKGMRMQSKVLKGIANLTGAAAWSAAEKMARSTGREAYFRYGHKVIAHQGDTYNEGLPGDPGFRSPAARSAWTYPGLWQDRGRS